MPIEPPSAPVSEFEKRSGRDSSPVGDDLADGGSIGIRKDSILATIILTLLATAGIQFGNIIPVFISVLEGSLGLTPTQAGTVASIDFYGAALGGLAATLLIGRLNWRRAAMTLMALLGIIELGSALLHEITALAILRGVQGVLGGFATGIAFSLLGRRHSPDASFAVMSLVQSVLSVIGLSITPALASLAGAPGMFFELGALDFGALALIPLLPDLSAPGHVRHAVTEKISRHAVTLSLLAIFLYQMGRMMLIAHMVRFGARMGLSSALITASLAVAVAPAALGALAAAFIAGRSHRTTPLLCGSILSMTMTLSFLAMSAGLVPHRAVTELWPGVLIVQALADAFSLNFYYGLCGAVDQSGRTAAGASFITLLGFAGGPIAGAVLISRVGFSGWLTSDLICAAAAATCAAVISLSISRSAALTSTSSRRA